MEEDDTLSHQPQIKTIMEICAAAIPPMPQKSNTVIYKYIVPKKFILNVLERVGIPQYKWYNIDYSSFKKLNENFMRNKFCDIVRPFLRRKYRFLVRKHEFTFDIFTRILRGLCKQHKIDFFFIYTRCSNKKITSVYRVGVVPPNQKRDTFLSIKPTYYDYYEFENE